MIRELPKSNNKRYQVNNNIFEICDKQVSIILDSNDFNKKIIIDFIKENSDKLVFINNINSVNRFNDLVKLLKKNNFNNKIVINLLAPNPLDNNEYSLNIINGLDNDIYLDLEDIPKNVKLKAFTSNNIQTEFTTWAHNLNRDDMHTLLNVLIEEDQLLFIEQRRVINNFYKKIIKNNPDFFKMNKDEQFNYLYNYIHDHFPYTTRALRNDGMGVKPEYTWTQDPIETYYNKTGVCSGRSNLLTLLTNNNYFRLKCMTCEGYKGSIPHSWNQYYDGKNILDYDLSYNIQGRFIQNMKEDNYRYTRVYPFVLNNKKKKQKIYRP